MECASEPGGIAAGTEPRSRRAAVYQDRPAPPPPDGRAFLCPDPASPAARAPRGPFHQQQVRSLRRHAWAAALAVFAVLALALPAAAQSVTTLVSNAGQSTTSAPTGDADRAQAFTTGAAGATLSSVEIISGDNEGDDMAVSLCTVDSSGYPTSSCTALTAPSSFASGTLVFTDPRQYDARCNHDLHATDGTSMVPPFLLYRGAQVWRLPQPTVCRGSRPATSIHDRAYQHSSRQHREGDHLKWISSHACGG